MGSFGRGMVNVLIGLARSTGDQQEILDPGITERVTFPTGLLATT